MITRTQFGAISYNTPDFLTSKLNELVEQGVLQFWYWIFHHAEEDELKDHKHVYMMPAKTVDTFALQKEFDEFDPNCPELPLKTLIGGHSQFAPKYLYDKHDVDFLASLGLQRKYHYNNEDFVTSCDDYFWELIHTSDFSKWKREPEFRETVKKGVPFADIFASGTIPIQQIYQYNKAYNILLSKYFPEQNDCTRYKQVIDPETGEAHFVPVHLFVD